MTEASTASASPQGSKWTAWVNSGSSRRQSSVAQLVEISNDNVEVGRTLLRQAERLQKKGNRKDASVLMDAVEKLIGINYRIIEVAGEIRDDKR
jgi:hypothetical protein